MGLDLGKVLRNITIRPLVAVAKGAWNGTNDIIYGANYKERAVQERQLRDLRIQQIVAGLRGDDEDRAARREELLLRRQQLAQQAVRDAASTADDQARAALTQAQLGGMRAAAKRAYGSTPVGSETTIDSATGAEITKPLYMDDAEQLANYQADLLETDRKRKAAESESLIGSREDRSANANRLNSLREELYSSLVPLNQARAAEINQRVEQGGPVRSPTARIDRRAAVAIARAYEKGDTAQLTSRSAPYGLDLLSNTFGRDSDLVAAVREARKKKTSHPVK